MQGPAPQLRDKDSRARCQGCPEEQFGRAGPLRGAAARSPFPATTRSYADTDPSVGNTARAGRRERSIRPEEIGRRRASAAAAATPAASMPRWRVEDRQCVASRLPKQATNWSIASLKTERSLLAVILIRPRRKTIHATAVALACQVPIGVRIMFLAIESQRLPDAGLASIPKNRRIHRVVWPRSTAVHRWHRRTAARITRSEMSSTPIVPCRLASSLCPSS